MVTIPDDFISSASQPNVVLPQGVIVDYKSVEDFISQQVLITLPTIVLIRSGIKKFNSEGTLESLAPAGSMIAFRSGAHVMSEFRAEQSFYQSFVVCFDRNFLKQAIGVPVEVDRNPPRSFVIDNLSSSEQQKLHQMPSMIESLKSETEREYRLRIFVLQAMEHPVVRNMFYHEVADWGASTEHRVSSILNAHYLSPLRVSDLALLCGMSLASFKRYFRKTFDTSPREWLQGKRLDHAYRLATGTELSVQEICEASGYRDTSSFIRAFSRKFNKTPRMVSLE